MTDPLPLVPATMIERKLARDGRARRRSPSCSRDRTSSRDVRARRGTRVATAVRAWRRPGCRPASLSSGLVTVVTVFVSGLFGRRGACERPPACRHAEAQDARDHVLHLAAIDDGVEHAVLEQELAALEPLGQRLPNRLLDDARAGEADERLRLGDVDVAEHREAGGDAAGRGIGQHRDVGQPRAIEPGQARR